MASVRSHENIELRTFSEVVEVSGYVGNFKVKIRKKARYVDIDKCSGCGVCWNICPASTVPSKRIIKKGDEVIKVVGGKNGSKPSRDPVRRSDGYGSS
jgi:heterodisulfide reductase subunit A-like polyferredoxin